MPGGLAMRLMTLARGMDCCSASGTVVGRTGGCTGANSASSMALPAL